MEDIKSLSESLAAKLTEGGTKGVKPHFTPSERLSPPTSLIRGRLSKPLIFVHFNKSNLLFLQPGILEFEERCGCMENGQASRRQNRAERMRKRRIKFFIVVGFLAACAAVIVVLFCAPVFNIQEVFCAGNEKISSEELIGTANVQMGRNIFQTNISEIKKRIAELPYVEESNVRRIFPNKIKIWVRENRPAAYLYSGDKLAVVDLSAKVLEVIDSPDQISQIAGDVSNQEESRDPQASASPAPSGSPGPSASPSPSPSPDAEEGDEGGEEGEGSEATPEPSVTPEPDAPEETPVPVDQFHQIPVLYGLELKHPVVGHKAASEDQTKFDMVISALNNLKEAGLLERTTKIDVTDLSDVNIVFENRLELLMGTLDNFKYKITFTATVINDKLSPYEHAIMDYRGKKLYVRSPESAIPKDFSMEDLTASASPAPKGDGLEEGGAGASPKPTAVSDEGDDGEEDEPPPTPKATMKPSPTPTATPAATPKTGGMDEGGNIL